MTARQQCFSLTILILALSLASIVNAQSGQLDVSFGGGDGVSTTLCRGGLRNGALQLDGKILMLFEGSSIGNKLVRLNSDGSLDESFGTNGISLFYWPAAGGGYGLPTSMVLQMDDGQQKIIVAGSTKMLVKGKLTDALRVDRFLPDGSPDPSFINGGAAIYKTAPAAAVAVQSDQLEQKIVTAGSLGQLVRLRSDGTLDTSFGSGGTANGNSLIYPWALAVQEDGKIVTAGSSNSKNKTLMTVARYNANGSVDTNFGTSGRATANFYGVWGRAFDVQLGPGGSITAGGSAYAVSSNNNLAIARFTSLGQLDGSFGGDGMVTYDSGRSDSGYGIGLLSEGKVVISGNAGTTGQTSDLVTARFDSAGNIDFSFGDAGGVITDIFGEGDYARDVLIQNAGTPDERIVVISAAYQNSNADLYAVAVRYVP